MKKKEVITCLIIYVDDMVIIGNDEEEIFDLKKKLSALEKNVVEYLLGLRLMKVGI